MSPRVSRLLVYPVRWLDPQRVEAARLDDRGALARDRRYALVAGGGRVVDPARTRDVHRLRSRLDVDAGTLALREHGGDDARTFDLDAERGDLDAWLTDFFGFDVSLERVEDPAGPTVAAEASFETTAGWIDGVDADGMRRRFRPNVVLADADAFWADRLFAGDDEAVAFDVGDATLEGLGPRAFQVAPDRDPDTGERHRQFRLPFVENRRDSLPGWANRARFRHYFELTVETRVPESSCGAEIAVGDEVSVGETRER